MAQDDLSKLKIDKSQVTVRPPARRKKTYVIILAAAVLIGLVLYFTGILRPSVTVETANVALVYPSQAITLLNASGYVVPQRKAAVAAKITGRLVSLYVEEGNRVEKGQMIARLESDDAVAAMRQAAANLDVTRHALEEARAELRDAEASFRREKNLLAKEFTTRSSYDAAEARYKKAIASVAAAEASIRANRAALQGAEVNVEYAQIRAPFDAVVLTKNADVGDIVTPIGAAANARASVVTIADMDSLQVEADVSESSIKLVKMGQPCEIQLDALPDTRLRGAIHMIVPTADRSKATVMVKVRFVDKDPRVLPEMSAKVAFLSREITREEEKPLTAVNPKAIRTRNGKKTAYLVQDDRVAEKVVTTGDKLGDFVEVRSGLKAGDRVVVDPPAALRDGSRVNIAEK